MTAFVLSCVRTGLVIWKTQFKDFNQMSVNYINKPGKHGARYDAIGPCFRVPLYKHADTHTHTHTHIYTYVHMYVHMYE